jgi:excisionase family DNA binding protein
MTSVEPLLTVHDAARVLRVSEATVRRWAADGTLPAIRHGRALRFAADVIVTPQFQDEPQQRSTS